MQKVGCFTLGGVVLFLYLIFFRTTPLLSGLLLDMFYINPVSWILIITALAFFGLAIYYGSDYNSEGKWPLPAGIGSVVTIIWILWLIFLNPLRMQQIYKHTQYLPSELIPNQAIRPVAYSIAKTNFEANQPDARQSPGDLDYVQDHWIASLDPTGFWNTLLRPTQGLYVFHQDGRVESVQSPFSFAETGLLWNSAIHDIRSEKYFVEFSDILFVAQPDGTYIAVTTLTRRAGLVRWPYIWAVAVIHQDGFVEVLPPNVAEADPRLADIALIPESYEKLRVEAYTYRNGLFQGMFSRHGAVSVHTSGVNYENSAPYHIRSVTGNLWYTPLAPKGHSTNSITHITMSQSHDIDSPVMVWSLPENTGLEGVDYLVSYIENSPNHSNIVWYRESGDTKCGNVTILEMVPVVRQEATGPKLYFLGYVSSAPTSNVLKFYTVIDPVTRVVYEDLPNIELANAWLYGQLELRPVSADSISINPVSGQCTLGDDLSQATDEVLIDYLRQITEELNRRLINP